MSYEYSARNRLQEPHKYHVHAVSGRGVAPCAYMQSRLDFLDRYSGSSSVREDADVVLVRTALERIAVWLGARSEDTKAHLRAVFEDEAHVLKSSGARAAGWGEDVAPPPDP